MKPTPTQTKILKFLEKHKCDVTTTDIAKHISYKGKYARQEVYRHLHGLADKGFIAFEYQRKRVIILTK